MPADLAPPAPFVPYQVGDYTVLEPEDPTHHRVATPDGQVIGVPCADSTAPLGALDLLAFIEHPPAVPVVRRQSARIVLDRLTDTEYLALTGCTVPGIQRGLEAARLEGLISEADADFPAFVAGCAALNIIAAERWETLLAP